jgi:transcriptional regulator with XRE-family HTH domain
MVWLALHTEGGLMTGLVKFLKTELARRNWRPADLARAAGVPDATISHILNGSRRAGPDLCNAFAHALDETPERIFRLAGLLPPMSPTVEEEREAVAILRSLPAELRLVAMRMLRSLRPGVSHAPHPPQSVRQEELAASGPARAPDPYLEVLEELWDKAPDWKKKDIAAQIRLAVEEYQRAQRAQGGQATSQEEGEASDAGRTT